MKYPTEVRVKNDVYKIEYVNTPREVDSDLAENHYCGMANHAGRVLRILGPHSTRPASAILETIVHEILHCVFADNPALKFVLKDDAEEIFIDTMAIELSMLLLDNDWIKLPKQGPPITTRIIPE